MVIDSEDQMLKMWGESMKDVNCKTALINYEDFVLVSRELSLLLLVHPMT